MAAILLDLRIHVAPERRGDFLAFLREAVPVYEAPGGIRVQLLESLQDPGAFIERVVYADRATYDADQVRVAEDPQVGALLGRWRALLDGPPQVEAWTRLDDGVYRSPANAP